MENRKTLNREMILHVEEIKAGLALRLLDTFLGHVPGRFSACRDGIRTGDWRAVEAAAHSMKSSSGQLGAERLTDICDRLETSAEAGDGPGVSGLAGEFESVYAETVAAMETERRTWITGKS